jgi:aerobic-type carbon monoxide dehydrogenase small subunit (CoxS/CutS family)
VSRRSFIKSVGVSAAASSLAAAAAQASGVLGRHLDDGPDGAAGSAGNPTIIGPDPVDITLNINGKNVKLKAEPATTLLEALRLHLNMTGAKEICDRGACGGCSVIIDGRVVTSCMLLAMDCVGSRITTVEGLASEDASGNLRLDPVQEMFVKHDAMQCGYCTPGFVMASRSLLNENPKPTLDQIKRALSGNICRCGTYTNIFNAVLEASGQAPIMDQKGT